MWEINSETTIFKVFFITVLLLPAFCSFWNLIVQIEVDATLNNVGNTCVLCTLHGGRFAESEAKMQGLGPVIIVLQDLSTIAF